MFAKPTPPSAITFGAPVARIALTSVCIPAASKVTPGQVPYGVDPPALHGRHLGEAERVWAVEHAPVLYARVLQTREVDPMQDHRLSVRVDELVSLNT